MMTPVHWIFVLIAICYIIFDIMKFEKNPEEYSKKKKSLTFNSTYSIQYAYMPITSSFE